MLTKEISQDYPRYHRISQILPRFLRIFPDFQVFPNFWWWYIRISRFPDFFNSYISRKHCIFFLVDWNNWIKYFRIILVVKPTLLFQISLFFLPSIRTMLGKYNFLYRNAKALWLTLDGAKGLDCAMCNDQKAWE